MISIDLYFPGTVTDACTENQKGQAVCTVHGGKNLLSTKALKTIATEVQSEYLILHTKSVLPAWGAFALERLIQVAGDSGAGMVYCDYWEEKDGERKVHPVNDYQTGSVRDDFDFGPMLFFRTEAFRQAVGELEVPFTGAGLYDLRLTLSRKTALLHLNECLYTQSEEDKRGSDEKMFAYVDPKNRAIQIEMEQACTLHLKAIGAWLPPTFESIDLKKGSFPVEASVIIPVRNRARTIADAVHSVLLQETSFPFNLIVIDNHSTDGTTEILSELAKSDSRIVHLCPERTDLGIGGCWNEGVQHEACGRFAIQLDSDDLYSGNDTLERIVEAFYEQDCTMLVGTYRMCDFDLNTLPPGIIDHKEWTVENGRNNALRINGLGAPRAFYTPVLRDIKVPNTSYGEDYALGLQFSRRWNIGRIFDVLYLCRRWEDNSDASMDQIRLNASNAYKDKLRSLEIAARQQLNSNKVRIHL